MTTGTIDSKSPVEVLADYRAKGHPVILDQARKFRSLSPSDQRELLFHMIAHETVVLNKMQSQLETLLRKPANEPPVFIVTDFRGYPCPKK